MVSVQLLPSMRAEELCLLTSAVHGKPKPFSHELRPELYGCCYVHVDGLINVKVMAFSLSDIATFPLMWLHLCL